MTTEQHITWTMHNGGESWFYRNRFHWQRRWADGQRVSTVFLGLDHSFDPHGRPRPARLWETCVFAAFDGSSDVTHRYTRRWDAAKGHLKMVAVVQFYRLKAALRREPRLKATKREQHT